LAGISLLVRTLQDIKQITPFDVKDHLLEGHASFLLEVLVLLVVPDASEDQELRSSFQTLQGW
jgi:hypothetical protein